MLYTHKRRVGRPRTEDALALYLYVRIGCLCHNMSVIEFCHQRGAKFGWKISSEGIDGSRLLKAEALRRRYNQARHELGDLPDRHPGICLPDDHHPERKVLNRMVADLYESENLAFSAQ